MEFVFILPVFFQLAGQVAGNLGRFLGYRHFNHQAAGFVVPGYGQRHGFKVFPAAGEGLHVVILAGDHFASAFGAFLFRRLHHMAARGAFPAVHDALFNEFPGYVHPDDHVHGGSALGQEMVQGFRLRNRAGIAVQQPCVIVHFRKPAAHHIVDDLVRNQHGLVHIAQGFPSQLRAGFHFPPQQGAGAQGVQVESISQKPALGSFAGCGRPNQDEMLEILHVFTFGRGNGVPYCMAL